MARAGNMGGTEGGLHGWAKTMATSQQRIGFSGANSSSRENETFKENKKQKPREMGETRASLSPAMALQ